MTLSELLNPELILVKTASVSTNELISTLAEKIYETNPDFPVPREKLLDTIFKREQIGGTMFPSGLSVPHARLGNFEGFVLALGTSVEPILYQGFKLRLMALMISSQTGGQYYLPTVAALTKISRDNEYFSRLCEAEDKDDFIRILMERDQNLG